LISFLENKKEDCRNNFYNPRKKIFVLDGVGDFWYNKYGIIIMGGSQNAI